ncbi:MAG: PfkB family carbohydrate kinase [Anaerolineae bacterium]|nr:PfkB family carbohydrate kinase [Anaerolineae bacterium]
MAERPAIVCVGSIIIDDIVLPDGATRMGVLGGGVTHAAAGVRAWGERPGIVACVGHDLPGAIRERLARDFDLQGLVALDVPQARAWQVFEWDGRRTEIFRVEVLEPFLADPQPEQVPAAYDSTRGLHLLRAADAVAGWRARFPGATILWEPSQQFMVAGHLPQFRAALPLVDIVSPNGLEAGLVYGLDDPARLVRAMLADGARVVALRLGADGSLVASADQPDPIHLPAIPVASIVDQTGAGNTYCGGFLAGWLAAGDLLAAACYGGAAASFALEVTGVLDPCSVQATERERRRQWLADRATVQSVQRRQTREV